MTETVTVTTAQRNTIISAFTFTIGQVFADNGAELLRIKRRILDDESMDITVDDNTAVDLFVVLGHYKESAALSSGRKGYIQRVINDIKARLGTKYVQSLKKTW